MHVYTWLPLLLWPVVGQANSTFPQTVDFHLLFPRNETYAPVAGAFPVVFSMTNTQLAGPMRPSFAYNLYNETVWLQAVSEGRTPASEDAWFSTGLTTDNFTSSDPFFWLAREGMAEEGTWRLEYRMMATICHANDGTSYLNSTRSPSVLAHLDSGHVIFTTKNGGAAVDLVASTANRSCLDVPYSRTLNVSGLLDVSASPSANADPLCAAVDFDSIVDNPTEPTNTATTCGIALDSATAASILAAVTSAACSIRYPPSYCPNAGTIASSAASRILSAAVETLSMASLGVLALVILL